MSRAVVTASQLVNKPLDLVQVIATNFTTRKALHETNEQLRVKLLLLNTEVQRLLFLEQENLKLRTLLNISTKLKSKMLVAQIIELATDNFVRELTINRGKQHGVHLGQPVLDAYGLLGQVFMVKPEESTVMLVTNNKSAVPVMVMRNGLQAIAVGTGDNEYLELINVPETADIKENDVLVTSGLGRIFPAGYQVGLVKEVKRVASERFMKVFVTPRAHINRSHHVFLVLPQDK